MSKITVPPARLARPTKPKKLDKNRWLAVRKNSDVEHPRIILGQILTKTQTTGLCWFKHSFSFLESYISLSLNQAFIFGTDISDMTVWLVSVVILDGLN